MANLWLNAQECVISQRLSPVTSKECRQTEANDEDALRSLEPLPLRSALVRSSRSRLWQLLWGDRRLHVRIDQRRVSDAPCTASRGPVSKPDADQANELRSLCTPDCKQPSQLIVPVRRDRLVEGDVLDASFPGSWLGCETMLDTRPT